MDWAKARRWVGIVLINLVLCSLPERRCLFSPGARNVSPLISSRGWPERVWLLSSAAIWYSPATTQPDGQIMLYGGPPLPQTWTARLCFYPAQLVPLLLRLVFLDKEVSAALWQVLHSSHRSGHLCCSAVCTPCRCGPALGILLWYYPLLMLYQTQFMLFHSLRLVWGYGPPVLADAWRAPLWRWRRQARVGGRLVGGDAGPGIL